MSQKNFDTLKAKVAAILEKVPQNEVSAWDENPPVWSGMKIKNHPGFISRGWFGFSDHSRNAVIALICANSCLNCIG